MLKGLNDYYEAETPSVILYKTLYKQDLNQ